MTTPITDNVTRVHEAVAAACARARRDSADVTVIAVSKQKPVPAVLEAATAGLQHFGESRVEEAQEKIPAVVEAVERNLTWHMIGHVQSRKAKYVPLLFDIVHSVDSEKVAERLSNTVQAMLVEPRKTSLAVLAQVNISGEAAKSGFMAHGWQHNPQMFEALCTRLNAIAKLPGLRLHGLMTIAPLVERAEQARPFFADLAALRESLVSVTGLDLPELSMGMTNDFEVAIEEGATQVRIGRAIFGERAY